MKSLIELLKYIFSCKCPECGEILQYEEYDAIHDKEVYKCPKCGETWF